MELAESLENAQPITALPERGSPFVPARRVQKAFTATLERRALLVLASKAPGWLTSDQLTALGLVAQAGAGVAFALAGRHRHTLFLVPPLIVLNWLGDSLDGTLARARDQQRPRFGFYVDHMVDQFGTIFLLTGLASSGMLHWQVAMAVLIGFLLLSSESYLATYTLGRFELSQGLFGPTELRLLLIAGTLALLRSPYAKLFGRRFLLFDIGGAIAAGGMFVLAVAITCRHTAQLFGEEPLP